MSSWSSTKARQVQWRVEHEIAAWADGKLDETKMFDIRQLSDIIERAEDRCNRLKVDAESLRTEDKVATPPVQQDISGSVDTAHAAPQLRDTSSGERCRYPDHPGKTRCCVWDNDAVQFETGSHLSNKARKFKLF